MPTATVPVSRLWARRAAATVLDVLGFCALSFVTAVVAPHRGPLGIATGVLVADAIWVAYLTLAVALSGATLGQWSRGLSVTRPDGRRAGPIAALARALLVVVPVYLAALSSLVTAVVALALLLDVVWALRSPGRALHDLATGTAVAARPLDRA